MGRLVGSGSSYQLDPHKSRPRPANGPTTDCFDRFRSVAAENSLVKEFIWDPVDKLPTLWIRYLPCGPTKRVSRVGWALSAVGVFGCQKAACFYSWTLWITTLTLRIRRRPSGSAPIEQQGRRVGKSSHIGLREWAGWEDVEGLTTCGSPATKTNGAKMRNIKTARGHVGRGRLHVWSALAAAYLF